MFNGMNMNQMMGMLNKQMDSNPMMKQFMAIKAALDKLPADEQKRVITNFCNEVNEAVAKIEGKK